MFITYSGINSMPDIAMKPNRRLLLFLPLAHVFARYMQFFCFAGNVSLGLSGNLKTILADFKAFKPTFILAVPRIFEKIYNAASQKAGAGLKGRIFAGATQAAYDWSHAQQSGGSIPVVLNSNMRCTTSWCTPRSWKCSAVMWNMRFLAALRLIHPSLISSMASDCRCWKATA